MGQAIPTQHPSVVLRSHFRLVRTLLALAMAAVAALTVAVVILAADGNEVAGNSSARPAEAIQLPVGTRYDGGPDEGTRGPAVSTAAPSARYDGGPEEGTRGPLGNGTPSADDPFKDRTGGPRYIP